MRNYFTRSGRASRPDHRVRLHLEALEDRTLLNAYTAGTVPDLIADINDANLHPGANTIKLVPGKTFTLTQADNTTDGPTGLPVIASGDNLTIKGNGDIIERSSADSFRLFDVASGASLTLKNLTLQNGLASGSSTSAQGGAIFNHGTLNLSYDVVSDNHAVGDTGANGVGGAIHSVGISTATATVNIDYSIFTDNYAIGGNGNSSLASGNGIGGAINQGAYSTLTVTGSAFKDNHAQGGSDGSAGNNAGIGQGIGGAINSNGDSTASPDTTVVTITGSLFANNQAVGGDGNQGGVGSFSQAGIGLGGAIAQGQGNLSVSSSVFTGNNAQGGKTNTGGDASSYQAIGTAGGGAIAFYRFSGTDTIEYSTFINNVAQGGYGNQLDTDSASAGYPSSAGGAIGGAIANVSANVSITVTNSTLFYNHAIGGAGASGQTGSDGLGGGIAVYYLGSKSGGLLNVTNSTITANTAEGGPGGDGKDGGNGRGGGLYIAPNFGTPQPATLTKTFIAGNTAEGGVGGSDGGNGGDGQGGGVFNVGFKDQNGVAHLGIVNLNYSNLILNQAIGGAGGSNGGNGGNGQGGGFYNAGNANLTGDGFILNTAIGGAGSTGGNGQGGGLYFAAISGASATLCNDTVAFNAAAGGYGTTRGTSSGGGIYIESGASVFLDDFTVAHTIYNIAANDRNIDGDYSPATSC